MVVLLIDSLISEDKGMVPIIFSRHRQELYESFLERFNQKTLSCPEKKKKKKIRVSFLLTYLISWVQKPIRQQNHSGAFQGHQYSISALNIYLLTMPS